ncbi:cellulase family glycosylhydrolase [Streptomyces sp. So13.3]|uniref:cellulase family glycosylhydrolase n=1 Tax=Streptomyces TaxID=1883 RepID=UPI0011073A8B|nr:MULTISPECIES: cellulase family glycosylhydrolase [Streptomyces]MCZ4101722.1 cellulase family glycosylhydrolase [Streptomyces sp. H39-C1]QNA70695.1 cellulase family glycosylhydrolase [Streptomyces sp. So13.3]
MKNKQAPQHRRRRLRLTVGVPLAAVVASALTYGTVFGTFGDDATPKASAAAAPVPANAMAAVAAMQPGWNLGNSLDAVPNETAWGQPRTSKSLVDKVRAQGFNSIRVPVTWSDHQGAAPNYTIDPAYISRVKEVIDWSIDDGLYVVLDVHHDSWQWTKAMSTDHDKVLSRFNSTWTQISAAFKNEPAKLVFESINEPQFDNADATRKAGLLNELNTSFDQIVRASGGNNKSRLLMLPTEGCTPDQALMNNLATEIKSLHDARLIATVHYYGYWPFSVNLAGSTRFDAMAQGDLDKAFQRMHNTFVAQGIPVILGEYGLLGDDHGPGGVERGEMLKYFEALGHASRTSKVTTVLWDNGSLFDRSRLQWKDAGLFRQIKSSWATRSATAASDNVFVPKSGPVKAHTLTLDLNGTTFKALKQGTTKLVNGKDYTLSGSRLTLKAATLTRLVGQRADGVNATLQAEFSQGVPWRIQVITYGTPVQSATTGAADAFRIPTQFRGDVLATMSATYADGRNAGPTDWTPYQQFNAAFVPDYAKQVIRLTPAFLDAVKADARVTVTFHFWSGAKVTYYVTKSGSTVTGKTS